MTVIFKTDTLAIQDNAILMNPKGAKLTFLLHYACLQKFFTK